MQSTIDSTQPQRSLKRGLRLPYSLMISGLAIATAAFVGLGWHEDDGQAGLQNAGPAAETRGVSATTPAQVLVYLVATEADKRALEQDVARAPEWFFETYAGIDTSVRVIALGEGQEESLDVLARLLPEALLASGEGPSVKLVDMR